MCIDFIIGILVGLILYFMFDINKEGFGIDEKPFEPDNTLLNRNPWDDIDYIVPTFKYI
jgi:hypothetical protein